MRLLTLLGTLLLTLNAVAETPAAKLWNELKVKREALAGFHQEFEVSRTFKTAHGTQGSKEEIVLDVSHAQWREKSIAGSGNFIRIFDGKDLFRMEEGGQEYVRSKRQPKEGDPQPSAYAISDPDWAKAVEVERRPCTKAADRPVCVILEVPLKKWSKLSSTNGITALRQGVERVLLDTETGLLYSSRTLQVFENSNGGYQAETTYLPKAMSHGAPANPGLFQLASNDMREVKELSRWNADRIKKQLAGKPAPELTVTDLQGKPVSLTAFKGKTVLLDFWTTWCGPCRADGPALEKLYRRYGEKDLMIVGVSVNEERGVVEKFLQEHPHTYPIVLTTDNQMPRPYQLGVFPTYIVIDRDGTVANAVDGDQGFGDLRKLLKKAGLELE